MSDIHTCHCQGLIWIFDISLSQLRTGVPCLLCLPLIVCVAVWMRTVSESRWCSVGKDPLARLFLFQPNEEKLCCQPGMQRGREQAIYPDPVAPSYVIGSTRYDKSMHRVWVHCKKHKCHEKRKNVAGIFEKRVSVSILKRDRIISRIEVSFLKRLSSPEEQICWSFRWNAENDHCLQMLFLFSVAKIEVAWLCCISKKSPRRVSGWMIIIHPDGSASLAFILNHGSGHLANVKY